MGPQIRIDPAFFLLSAFSVLVVPLNWLCAAVAAAVFHELCHYAAIRLCGGRVNALALGTSGTVMGTSPMDMGAEVICAAAGPAGSLFLLIFAHRMPQLALCGAVQGMYNLLPVYPLDGGRVVRCLVSEKIFLRIQWAAIALLLLTGAVCSIHFNLGAMPGLFALLAAIRALARKFPCKDA